MKNRRTTTVLIAASALLTLGDIASAYYNPRTGRFLNRDPIDEAGAILVSSAAIRGTNAFIPRDPEETMPITSGGVSIVVPSLRSRQELAATILAKAKMEEPNLYQFALSAPTNNYDPLGLSTTCGSVECTCCKGTTTYTVKGDSARARTIIPIWADGCVTLPITKESVCTGSCADVRSWTRFGRPLLDHECCHACANHDNGFGDYLLTWIPGDLTNHCDRHAKRSRRIGW